MTCSPYTWAPGVWKVYDDARNKTYYDDQTKPWEELLLRNITPNESEVMKLHHFNGANEECSMIYRHRNDKHGYLMPYMPEGKQITLPCEMSLGRAIEWYRMRQIKDCYSKRVASTTSETPHYRRTAKRNPLEHLRELMPGEDHYGGYSFHQPVDSLEVAFWKMFGDREDAVSIYGTDTHEINCHKRSLALVAKHRLTPWALAWLGESLVQPIPSEYLAKRCKPRTCVMDFVGNGDLNPTAEMIPQSRFEHFMNRLEVAKERDQQAWFWSINMDYPEIPNAHRSNLEATHWELNECDADELGIEDTIQHLTMAILFMCKFGRNRNDKSEIDTDGLPSWGVGQVGEFVHQGEGGRRINGYQSRWAKDYRSKSVAADESRRAWWIASNFGVHSAVLWRWQTLARSLVHDYNEMRDLPDFRPLSSKTPWDASHEADLFPYHYLQVIRDLNCDNGIEGHDTHKKNRRFLTYTISRVIAEEIVRKMQNEHSMPRRIQAVINGI